VSEGMEGAHGGVGGDGFLVFLLVVVVVLSFFFFLQRMRTIDGGEEVMEMERWWRRW